MDKSIDNMSCDRCHRDCFLYLECTKEERLPFRNFDKFYGTPERAANSIMNDNDALLEWMNNEGFLICYIDPEKATQIWLEKEYNGDN